MTGHPPFPYGKQRPIAISAFLEGIYRITDTPYFPPIATIRVVPAGTTPRVLIQKGTTMHRETKDSIQITKADHSPLVGEVRLKLEQTPVRESLQADYDALLQALQSLRHSEDTASISKFQLELLRNVISAGALQGSALAGTITDADHRLPENGTILLALI